MTTETIEPMTAAEYRRMPGMVVNAVLAALEERERLLGRVAELEGTIRSWQPSADAALGALVRRIAELAPSAFLTWDTTPYRFRLYADGLQSALDSLLPKEPEVHDAPSGRQYRKRDDGVIETRYRTRYTLSEWCNWFPLCETILVPDAPVVAKLMEGAR